jgi:hypothetical protein
MECPQVYAGALTFTGAGNVQDEDVVFSYPSANAFGL